ncbi:MAG: hypothetical protein ACJ8E2_11220, partial [Bradyrhizobium sp.]
RRWRQVGGSNSADDGDKKSPITGYPMHTSLLRRSSNTDSLFLDGAEGDRCRRRWGWGDLAIAAWKKGGLVA